MSGLGDATRDAGASWPCIPTQSVGTRTLQFSCRYATIMGVRRVVRFGSLRGH
jgi:hypothetical protein